MRTAAAFLIAASAFAQPAEPPAKSQQSCPVVITNLDTANGLKAGYAAVLTHTPESKSYIRIQYGNRSDKDVLTVRFQVAYLNLMREFDRSSVITTRQIKVKPGKVAMVVGPNGTVTVGEKMPSMGWVEKVLFAGGTYWTDDGSHSCSGQSKSMSR